MTSGETVEVPLTCESSKQGHALTGRLRPVHPPRAWVGVRGTVIPDGGGSRGNDPASLKPAAD